MFSKAICQCSLLIFWPVLLLFSDEFQKRFIKFLYAGLLVIALNLRISMEVAWHFYSTRASHAETRHASPFTLLCSYSTNKILWLSLYRSRAFLIKFTPKCFAVAPGNGVSVSMAPSVAKNTGERWLGQRGPVCGHLTMRLFVWTHLSCFLWIFAPKSLRLRILFVVLAWDGAPSLASGRPGGAGHSRSTEPQSGSAGPVLTPQSLSKAL